MIQIESLRSAVAILGSDAAAWSVVLPGLAIGLVGGAIPGLSVSLTMAIFLPLAMYMDFLPAVLFLTSIFTGGGFGGAISAILMNIPGTTSAVATTLDGYPLARSGRHNEALGCALGASCIGTILSYLVLLFLIDPIAALVLSLGPPEMFLIMLWGLSMIAILGDRDTARGLVSGGVGVLIGTIGMNSLGRVRGTLGIPELLDGVALVPAMIGLLAVPELLRLVGLRYISSGDDLSRAMSFRKQVTGFGHAFSFRRVLLRGSAVGVLVGAIPGVGSSIANLISYSEARRNSANPEAFGQGAYEGLIAAESANSSAEGGSMATLLALGIPGGAGTAVLLAALNMHNITGGPRFIDTQMDVVYAIILGNLAQAALLIPLGFAFIYLCSGIVKIPARVIAPVILALIVFGTYAITGSMLGPYTVLAFGIVGYIMQRHGYSMPAMVVGLILGGLAEGELLRSLQLTQGRLDLILNRPITILLLVLLMVSFFGKPLALLLRKLRLRSRRS